MGTVVKFIDRRRNGTRVHMALPVALVHANGTAVTALTEDLSLGGLRVRCDRYTADCLQWSDRPITARRGARVDAHLRLPTARGLLKFDAQCRLAYCVGAAAREFLIGLEIEYLEADARYGLEQFLSEAICLDRYPD